MRKIIVLLPIILFAVTLASAQVISGNYAIKNVQTGMLLRVKDAGSKNGTPLVAYYPQNWKCMTWDFKNTGPNTYQLQNLLTNKTFQAQGEAGPGVALEEQPLTANASNQQYEFISVKADVFLIRLKGSDLYVTPADAGGKVNSAIILAKKNNTPTQYWSIYQQAPTM